jgi:hypothetical protein
MLSIRKLNFKILYINRVKLHHLKDILTHNIKKLRKWTGALQLGVSLFAKCVFRTSCS